jgi:hypothetical protein
VDGSIHDFSGVLCCRFVVVPEGMPATSVLTKLLRREMKLLGPDSPVPRVMTFVRDATAAKAIANPLRAALWEEHRIGLVLPLGQEPTKTLQARLCSCCLLVVCLNVVHLFQLARTSPFLCLLF